MIIENIHILKTPLDREYRNVFDFNDETKHNRQSLKTRMLELFPFIEPNTAIDYNINENRELALTVRFSPPSKLFPMSKINEYNYCIVTGAHADDVLFYFIKDYTILNSASPTPPNQAATGLIRLNLEWDSWNNNIDIVREYGAINYCVRRTLVDLKLTPVNGVGDTVIAETTPLQLQDTEVRLVERTNEHDTLKFANDISATYKEPHKILWQRIWFDSDAVLKNEGDGDSALSDELYGAIPSLNPVRVVYFPIAVVNCVTRRVNPNFTHWNYKLPLYDSPDIPLPIPTTNSILKLKKSDHVINSELTYHSPIPRSYYSFEDNNHTVEFHGGNEGMGGLIVHAVGNFLTEDATGIGGVIKRPLNSHRQVYSVTSTAKYEKEFTKSHLEEIYGNANDNQKMLIIPEINMYPYNYKSVICGDKRWDLIGEHGVYEYAVTYDTYNRTNVSIKVFMLGEGYVTNVKSEYAYNSGNVPYAIDSLDIYMRENSARIATSTAITALATGATATTGNPLPLIYGIGSVAGSTAGIIDAGKSQNNYKNLDFLALNDIEYQDDIYVIDNIMEDYFEKVTATRELHDFGIRLNRNLDHKYNYFANFDYFEFVDMKLPSIANTNDRKKIENAYNRGITRWHLDTCHETPLKRFNKAGNNLPLSLYNFMREE